MGFVVQARHPREVLLEEVVDKIIAVLPERIGGGRWMGYAEAQGEAVGGRAAAQWSCALAFPGIYLGFTDR